MEPERRQSTFTCLSRLRAPSEPLYEVLTQLLLTGDAGRWWAAGPWRYWFLTLESFQHHGQHHHCCPLLSLRLLLGVLVPNVLDLLPWEGVRVEGRLFCDPWPILASDWPCSTTSARLFPQSWFLCTSQFKTSVNLASPQIVNGVRNVRSRQEPCYSRLLCIFPLPSLLSHWATSTLFFNHNMKYIFIEKNPNQISVFKGQMYILRNTVSSDYSDKMPLVILN